MFGFLRKAANWAGEKVRQVGRWFARNTAKTQVAMSVISTATTVATVAVLAFTGQWILAAAVASWSVLCNVVALTNAYRSHKNHPTASRHLRVVA